VDGSISSVPAFLKRWRNGCAGAGIEHSATVELLFRFDMEFKSCAHDYAMEGVTLDVNALSSTVGTVELNPQGCQRDGSSAILRSFGDQRQRVLGHG
jgi:hypothetical protein